MIDRIGKFLGLDLRYLLFGGSYQMISQALPLLLGVVSSWFLTQYFSKEFYGAYSYIQALMAMLALFTLPGYFNAVFRSVARGYEGCLMVSVRRRMLFSVIGSLIMVGVAGYYHFQGEKLQATGALVGSLFLGLTFGLDDFRAFLNGQKRFALFTVYHVGLQLVATVVTVIALLLTEDYLIVLAANLGSRGIGQLVATMAVAAKRKNDEVETGFYKFGNHLTWLGALGAVSFQIDRVVVGAFFPLEAMADYNLASVLTNPLRNLGVAINRLLFPKMVVRTGRQFAMKTFWNGLLLTAGLCVVGLVFYFALPFVLHWLFPKYTGIDSYANWMMISSLVAVVVIYLETYYLSQDELSRTYTLVNILRPLAIIVVLAPSMMIWGIFGAIYSRLAVRLLEAVYLLVRIYLGWDEGKSGSK